jgi:CspA family cold shock protein
VRAWTRQHNFRLRDCPAPLEQMFERNPIQSGASMAIGTVKFFNSTKGFGFISPEGGGKDVFVHATAVEMAGMRSLAEGQKVSFDIQPDARGSKAVNLKAA